MKKVSQRLRDGRVEVVDVPFPELSPDGVLIDVRATLVSAGTERSKIEMGRQSLIGKARSRPDQVREVIDKARRDGVRATAEAVRARLDQPSELGYSAAGVVLSVGDRVRGLAPGDPVAAGGGGHAVHADVDHVPSNLCVPLPKNLSFEEGAFATLGSIALHGIRQADARVGERVAVIGLGLVGQLACRILRAAGCHVTGVDVNPKLVHMAREGGGADLAVLRSELDRGTPTNARDCDAVVITAATETADPVEVAARLCRDRGRVVVVGDVQMAVPRAAYYEKELELRLSRSYGPGRYDRNYEERGLDYPIGYVRWTERRNMAAFLELISRRSVRVEDLISKRVPIDQAPTAYAELLSRDRPPLGIILKYGSSPPRAEIPRDAASERGSRTAVGVIGTGSFARRVVIPGLRDAGFTLEAVASASGLSAHAAQEAFGFSRLVEPEEAIADDSLGLAVIVTRHASHATLAASALLSGKAVFVEKPPCLTRDELAELRSARDVGAQPLVVGFNRRHAPLSASLKTHIANTGAPVELSYRVGAGRLPHDHWLNDPDEGGGRLLGEGCHFVDFLCWLLDALPTRVSCIIGPIGDAPLKTGQRFIITLEFADGSLASIDYGTEGSPAIGKESVHLHTAQRSAVLDDFTALDLYDGRRKRRTRNRSQDKGHQQQFKRLRALVDGDETEDGPDPLDTMSVTLAALDSASSGEHLSMREFLPRQAADLDLGASSADEER